MLQEKEVGHRRDGDTKSGVTLDTENSRSVRFLLSPAVLTSSMYTKLRSVS